MKKLIITGVAATLVFGAVAGIAGDSIAYARYNGCGNNCGNNCIYPKANQQTDTSVDTLDTTASTYDYGAQAAENDTDLTLEEMLVYAIQDEYLARAKYETVMDLYGQNRPFLNIESAEVSHISALQNLFRKYGIDIPEDEAMNYIVYPSSLQEAYEMGVTGEIENIDMYNRFLEENLPRDVKNVFTSLRNASEKHLRTFQRHTN